MAVAFGGLADIDFQKPFPKQPQLKVSCEPEGALAVSWMWKPVRFKEFPSQ
jgi:hypothetical protein